MSGSSYFFVFHAHLGLAYSPGQRSHVAKWRQPSRRHRRLTGSNQARPLALLTHQRSGFTFLNLKRLCFFPHLPPSFHSPRLQFNTIFFFYLLPDGQSRYWLALLPTLDFLRQTVKTAITTSTVDGTHTHEHTHTLLFALSELYCLGK